MKNQWRTLLHWPWAHTQASINRTEALTIAATKVVARKLWNYSIPRLEMERLGRMRNLQETLAALRYRRRMGEAASNLLIELSSSDETVDNMLTRLSSADRTQQQFARKIQQLRLQHRQYLRDTFSDHTIRWRLLVELNRAYVRRNTL
jgi:hypothetical protein